MAQPTPFLIEAQLESPVIISPEAYLTLDSLLSASCQLFGDDDTALPLRKTADVYHASAGILVGRPIQLEAPFVSRMTLRDYADPRILPNKPDKRGGGKLVIKTVAFPDMARLDRYTAHHYPSIIWFGNGDPEKALGLISRLTGIGKRCNAGYGQLGSVSVLLLPTDFSLKLPDQTPARPLPIFLCGQCGIDAPTSLMDRVTYKPNYFDFNRNAALCAVPVTRQISEGQLQSLKDAA
ncbi:MAG: hypothetical protein U1E09_00440 [Methylococcales bacterium]|nr:hypothetical protein [Methylobacter sp.]MDZ4154992.1 hypothetical protein [Methylococcales bacterium]MDP2099959.1 hypothetical protein [Methylobacter sp.]MDP2428919.1 hypothetical protein [Methylobacter sp.]MDP3055153.1 hypothetical protein [Methylobacter sp.]